MSLFPKLKIVTFVCVLMTNVSFAVVNFQFEYIDPEGEGFNDKSMEHMKEAVERAGSIMGGWIGQNATVKIQIQTDNSQTALASAYSYSGWSGQNRQILEFVREKIVSGKDYSRGGADGNIAVNLNNSWNLGDGKGGYLFSSVIFHELTHALGLASSGGAVRKICNKKDDDDGRRYYTLFETFIENAIGDRLIGKGGIVDEGFVCVPKLYFGGPRAVAAYGEAIPLYSPKEYEPGSSYSHLDYSGGDKRLKGSLMLSYAGQAMEWNEYERAIMEDLGYEVMHSGMMSEGNLSPIPEYSSMGLWVGFVVFFGVIGSKRMGRG